MIHFSSQHVCIAIALGGMIGWGWKVSVTVPFLSFQDVMFPVYIFKSTPHFKCFSTSLPVYS